MMFSARDTGVATPTLRGLIIVPHARRFLEVRRKFGMSFAGKARTGEAEEICGNRVRA
jgi:hypothetical protein